MSGSLPTLDLTLPSPAENLALDEALLLEAEGSQGPEVLRFWMSSTPFVVIGLGAKAREEVNLESCCRRDIPVLRRCSGGGTVVQGPGCLSYSLVLRIPESGPLAGITATNRFIMNRHATALAAVLGRHVTVEGHTDLALDHLKVSGNAQRRMRRHLLFHGTFLLDFDLDLITELLPEPALQPAYRHRRSHHHFLRNLNLPEANLKQALRETWQTSGVFEPIPRQQVAGLVTERYGRPDWNFRR
ncbi:MAG: lipoate--protein ligase family protein [Verrucomicrobia bacterium]|jgi:lipoate-protein ligase A|nr:lipoate--protein ligase family protein [Verrucomicrobiota bacterium]